MIIYLNGNEITANILSSQNAVLDETLDTFSFFFVNDDPNPIKPMGEVVVSESGTTHYFVVSADDVERFSLVEEKYKHSVSCTENTRVLSKYMVRNSVFTQPKNKYKTFYSNFAFSENGLTIEDADRYYGFGNLAFFGSLRLAQPQRITLTAREKVARAFVELSLQVAIAQANNGTGTQTAKSYNDLRTIQDVKDLCDNLDPAFSYNTLTLHYTLGGNDFAENLPYVYFNEEEECPRIVELLNQGASDIYVDLNGGQFFLNATQHTTGRHIPFYSLQIKIKLEVYWYSAYDILSLLLERHKSTHVIGLETKEREAPFKLPSSGELYTLLNNTIAPNFTFTQCTIYEAVAEVFRLFDAIFTMDGSGTLGITYFNDRGDVTNPRKTGTNSAISEERYNNGLVSFYQDARTEENFPHGKNYAPARTENIGIPDQGDHSFIVPHTIHDITQVVLCCELKAGGVVSYNGLGEPSQTTEIRVSDYPLDITHNVIEKSIWSSYLDTDDVIQYENNYLIKQNNTIYFEKGGNSIALSYSYKASWGATYYAFGNLIRSSVMRQLGLEAQFNTSYYETTKPDCDLPSWADVLMRADYLTSVDGKLKIESVTDKFDGEMVIDQSNGSVDLNKLGLNILGLSLKMGEPTLNVSCKATTWANRVKPGQTMVYQNSLWVANSCNYVALGNGYYQGKVSFVKNYNELSLRKQLLREKRLSNISQGLTEKSEDTIVEYCYFSSQDDLAGETACFDAEIFNYCIGNSFGLSTPVKSLDYFVMSSYDASGHIYLPSIRYGAGNMVCFETSYESPVSAGIKTDTSTVSGWFGTQSYYSSYVPYADMDGFMGKCSLALAINAEGNFDDNFPYIPYPANVGLIIEDYEVEKQPNEVFALNYEIAFLPKEQNRDFIGSAFINDNFLVSGKPKRKKLYVWHSEEPYSVLDTEGRGTKLAVTGVAQIGGEITFTHEEGEATSYWAICDERGNILFASNSECATTYKRVYFALRNSRL